jgi:hypothetical protein
MNTVLNKIFLENSQDGYKMRFGDMHNTITDYFMENKIDYTKYLSDTDVETSVVSTMSMGIFSALMVYKGSSDQKNLISNYITELSQLINTTDYMRSNFNIGFESIKKYFESFFENDEKKECEKYESKDDDFYSKLTLEDFNYENIPTLTSNLFINNKHKDFKCLFNIIKNIFDLANSGYHDDYITQVALTMLAFINTIEDKNNRDQLLKVYIYKMLEMDKLASVHAFYDKPNYRGYIRF